MANRYEILIDSREKYILKMKVKSEWKLPYIECPLGCGDLALRYAPVGGKTRYIAGAERKAMNDLIQSIGQKRIFDQVKRMTEFYDINFLCVVGSLDEMIRMLKDKVGIQINPERVYGTLASITVRNKFHLMWFPDEKSLFTVMYKIFVKISEEKYGEPLRLSPKFAKFNATSTLSDHVPGVTKKIARRLLAKFGSLRGIAIAQPKNLSTVDGVGNSTAKLIHRLLNEMNK